ncbi:MAG: hypothetical protein IRZ00_07630 [Gemmatimonadetes bacterium]|nr:hypothetical protein [Gemmatimonadota bacterium]
MIHPLRPVPALSLGALAVALLDIADALVFFGLRGVAPIRVFQSIAGGLLGPATFQGGLATAALGGLLHLLIATCIVATYHLASRKVRTLARRPLRWGPLYGIVVYGVMNLVVLPLSAAGGGPKPLAAVVNGLLIHILGVGLPSALSAWLAAPPPARDREAAPAAA